MAFDPTKDPCRLIPMLALGPGKTVWVDYRYDCDGAAATFKIDPWGGALRYGSTWEIYHTVAWDGNRWYLEVKDDVGDTVNLLADRVTEWVAA